MSPKILPLKVYNKNKKKTFNQLYSFILLWGMDSKALDVNFCLTFFIPIEIFLLNLLNCVKNFLIHLLTARGFRELKLLKI